MDLNQIISFFYVVIGSSATFPWLVEFVTKKVHGWKKVTLMLFLSLIVTLLTWWKNDMFATIEWQDIGAVLGITGTMFLAWAASWKSIFHDLMNPLSK